jgi:hypothetical protein
MSKAHMALECAPKGSKAAPIVGPILARGIAIGSALTREIGWGVKDKQRVPIELGREQAGGFAEQTVKAVDRLGALGSGHDRRIAGQQRRDGDALCGQRCGQGPHDIGKATGLDERHSL